MVNAVAADYLWLRRHAAGSTCSDIQAKGLFCSVHTYTMRVYVCVYECVCVCVCVCVRVCVRDCMCVLAGIGVNN